MEDLSQFLTPLSAQWTVPYLLLSIPPYNFLLRSLPPPPPSPHPTSPFLTEGGDGNGAPERVVEAEENELERGTK